ncbi:AAA family ATPase [Streptomyces caniscabiei]|uniref:AAA family ATPase n=1 Tax=Streptomyces caniscabiei TaxID=2746961 RepID=UPI0018722C75|nr:AAA family ATPase [Streptomyces caniscabiei]MBE4783958.1 AAA family ATPase [Streptomyces caniscabiei]MBE4791543.1 AAA family ATPase [Streptomyces caniscabiei]MDX3009220.1 AAA family ATPase [Streptomyces caniscabiei]
MTTFTFAPATRETAKARIALQGPGGSGKTKTALRMAEALAKGGLIGVVDSERGSALKYAPVPGRPDIEAHEFVHVPMAFCSPENLIAVVKSAEEARLAVLIIDSWSHYWAGKGGLLARVEEEGKKISGGKFSAWAPVNEMEQDMLDVLLGFPGHVIVTMRTKNDYELSGGKVKKLGVKTVQREGAEYEVDVVIDMVEGTGTVTKTRYSALDGACVHHPGPDFAEAILEQLGQGVDPVQVIVDELVRQGLTYDRALELHSQAQSRNLLGADLLHPKTGEPGKLGDLIKEYGQAVKPAATPVTNAPSTPSAPPAGQKQSTPAGAPSDAGQAQAPTPVTAPQMRMMHACFSKVGLGHKDSRAERLRATSLIIGRQIGSANELTKDEAQTLLDTLTAYGNRENGPADFAAMVQGLEDEDLHSRDDATDHAA